VTLFDNDLLSLTQPLENKPKTNRSYSETIDTTKKGRSKTKIMFKANLSFSQPQQYISLLLNRGAYRRKCE